MTVWTRDEGGEPRPMTDAELADYRAKVRAEGYELVTEGPALDAANARLAEKPEGQLIQVSALLVPLDGSPGTSAVMQPLADKPKQQSAPTLMEWARRAGLTPKTMLVVRSARRS